MTSKSKDIWYQWLLERQFGGNKAAMQEVLSKYLIPWRDRVLSNAGLQEGQILLDVGCGDGLIAFGALEKFKDVKVIFSDISQDLLDHDQQVVKEMGFQERCRFIRAPANDLSIIANASVDAVTTRSVLIYVKDKIKAIQEFHRVLRNNGRISIFEPINRFCFPEPEQRFSGYDITTVKDTAQKIKNVFEQIQPPGQDPMVDFDERDLLADAEKAGFTEIRLDLHAEIVPSQPIKWEEFIRQAGNPKIPTLEEAMNQLLTAEEAERFEKQLRPSVEAGRGMQRRAYAFLWAVK